MDSPRHVRFATTRWSLVATAGRQTRESAAALEMLCGQYWPPLYVFLRRRGHSPQDAEDLVQGFLADLLRREDLAAADSRRGRFRTFLLAGLKHHAANRHAADTAAKRGGSVVTASLETPLDFAEAESHYRQEPSDARTAEAVFERQWALAVLRRALADVEQSQQHAGRGEWFEQLRPLLTGGGTAPYAELAASLNTTPGAVKAAAARLRRQFREALDQALRDGLSSADDLAAERAALFAALST